MAPISIRTNVSTHRDICTPPLEVSIMPNTFRELLQEEMVSYLTVVSVH